MPLSTPAWEITGQREDYKQGPTGQFVTGMVVQFRTASGSVGSVFVPDSQYTADAVRAAVGARAAVIDQVAGLKG